MKFAVFTVMTPDCTIDRTIELLQENGYEGVEWRFTKNDPAASGQAPSFWGNNLSTIDADLDEAGLAAIKAKADTAGLAMPNLAAYIRSGDLEATERAMRAAQLLGAPSIRVGVPSYDRSRSYGELFKEARAYLARTEELSAAYGVKGLIEIHHGNIASSASGARRLVEGFDPGRIGVIYDPGNMVHEGFEQYRMGLEALGEYLGHVHVKNASWARTNEPVPSRAAAGSAYGEHNRLWQASWCPVAAGVVHWPQVIADLKAVGYDEWLSFEDFSASASTETLLKENLAYIQSLL